jgi:hypothetical protein
MYVTVTVRGVIKSNEPSIFPLLDVRLDVRELASRYVDELEGRRDPKTGRKYTREQRIAMAHERHDLASHGLTLKSFGHWKDRSKKTRPKKAR